MPAVAAAGSHAPKTVTGVRVQDPLYPHGSSVWGRSPKPNSLVTPATLAMRAPGIG